MPKTREQIIHAMCLTWDHCYGAPTLDDGVCGMSQTSKDFLFRNMAQVFDHEIAPLLGMGPAKANTVRVRAAVAINADGQWACFGSSIFSDEKMQELANDSLPNFEVNHDTLHWIEASVPVPVIPTPQVIEGVVQS